MLSITFCNSKIGLIHSFTQCWHQLCKLTKIFAPLKLNYWPMQSTTRFITQLYSPHNIFNCMEMAREKQYPKFMLQLFNKVAQIVNSKHDAHIETIIVITFWHLSQTLFPCLMTLFFCGVTKTGDVHYT